MQIQEIKIRNFKAIENEHLELKGNNVYVCGPNGVGKSSFIDAVFKVLTGKDLPSKVVKKGEKRGLVEINLGDYIIQAAYNAKDEKVSLSITNPDGALYKSPRAMLDEMIGVIDFDVSAFFKLSSKKQVDFIKEIIGIDFSDVDEEYKRVFDERTFVNRKVKELEAQEVPFDKNKLEEIDIKELQDKYDKATHTNNQIAEVERRFEERERELVELNKRIDKIYALQSKAGDWLGENTPVRTDQLKEEFDAAIEHNKSVVGNKSAKRINEELKIQIEAQEQLNEKLKSIEEVKRVQLSKAKMPVEGLTFDDNQLYLNGLPFEGSQINTAQQIITGLQINLALLKDVKIARFDGSLLDNSNMAIVEKWAKENSLQLFVEIVERDGSGLHIEIKE